ncbi:MAG: gamma-glutamylcyclotransferase family protein [Gammaproteobacteria bacterium]|nr:gamma-glutamylcyclotransferase family protein [Gammaproteobacteria bacterium]
MTPPSRPPAPGNLRRTGVRYYFAYGINMDDTGMSVRCPGARQIGVAALEGFRFALDPRGFATVVRDRRARVLGVLWTLSARDERALDAFEAVRHGLYRKERLVVAVGRRRRRALVYRSRGRRRAGRPRRAYLREILRAARRQGLDQAYVTTLERLLI